MERYTVTRVLNNNAVIAEKNSQNILLLGLSIGFKKKIGSIIFDNEIEKKFVLRDSALASKLEQLIVSIPEAFVNFTFEMVNYVKATYPERINDNLYITLLDHIYGVVHRVMNNQDIGNSMLLDIKSFYKKEFEIGQYICDCVQERFNVVMSDSEASFIALHIVNATTNSTHPLAMDISRFIERTVNLVEEHLKIKLDSESLDYFRFVTHLKNLGRKIYDEHMATIHSGDQDLYDLLKVKYNQSYNLAKLINADIQTIDGYELNVSDKLYLMIHLQRLLVSLQVLEGGASGVN